MGIPEIIVVDITGCGLGGGGGGGGGGVSSQKKQNKKTSLFLFFHAENFYCHAHCSPP